MKNRIIKVNKLLLTVLVLLALTDVCPAQQRHWVYFSEIDDAVLPASETDCSEDLIQKRLNHLKMCYDLEVEAQSKWLNAASFVMNEDQIEEVENLPFVEKVEPVISLQVNGLNDPNPRLTADAITQSKGKALRSSGLTGKGVKIGIIDVGYAKADITPSLKALFDRGQVKEVKDFLLGDDKGLFSNIISADDSHGTAVWQMIAGVDNRVRFGLATDAEFYIARTDHGKYEFRAEEDKWIEALEWLHSKGVRLVNSSLGYSLDFDDPDENHSPSDLDGKTLAISRAAQIAVEEKNMIIVVAAGNEGAREEWKTLNAPSDAEGVIAVGATDWSGFKRNYSAEGPEDLSFVKPDIAIYSDGGTSLAAPAITGMIACLLQKNPNLTNKEIKNILARSSSLYPYNNNYLGYGIPNAVRMLSVLKFPDRQTKLTKKVKAKGTSITVELSNYPDAVSLFHKQDKHVVVLQEGLDPDQIIMLQKKDGIRYTTIVTESELVEVEW